MAKKPAKAKPAAKRRGNQTEELNTHLREEFLRHYVGGARFNASEALRRATGNPQACRQQAADILKCPKVQDALAKRIFEQREIASHVFVQLLKVDLAILEANLTDVVDLSTGQLKKKIPRRSHIALTEFNVKEYEGGRSTRVKMADKGAASTRLAKILSLCKERDPLENERNEIDNAGAAVRGRVGGLRARLVPQPDSSGTSPDGGGAEAPPL